MRRLPFLPAARTPTPVLRTRRTSALRLALAVLLTWLLLLAGLNWLASALPAA